LCRFLRSDFYLNATKVLFIVYVFAKDITIPLKKIFNHINDILLELVRSNFKLRLFANSSLAPTS